MEIVECEDPKLLLVLTKALLFEDFFQLLKSRPRDAFVSLHLATDGVPEGPVNLPPKSLLLPIVTAMIARAVEAPGDVVDPQTETFFNSL